MQTFDLSQRKIFKAFFLGCLLMSLAMNLACNHLFYFPDDLVRTTPDKLDLDFKEFHVKTKDQIVLHGWWIQSDLDTSENTKSSAKPAPLGTIVQFHGNAQNMTAHFLYLTWLVPLGFDLVVFDYRGYGKSQGEPTREGMVHDAVALMNWVRTHSRSPNIIVIGQSLGGAVAIPSLVQNGFAGIKALVVDSTFASYREVARLKLADFFVTWPFQYPLSYLVTDDYSPQDFIGKLTVPKLFIHAVRDPVVPFDSGKKLYDLANPPKEFWTIPPGGVGDGHTGAFGDQNPLYRRRLVDYLCQQLAIVKCPVRLLSDIK